MSWKIAAVASLTTLLPLRFQLPASNLRNLLLTTTLLCWAGALLPVGATDSSPVVPTFVEKGREAHLDKIVVSGEPEKRFLIESVGGGLAVIDYNNDGWMDLYVANGGTIESARSGEGG